MRNVIGAGVLLIGVCIQALALSVPGANAETVTLKDGRTYNVPTGDGMPLPFKSGQIEVMALGPVFRVSGKGEWGFLAKLVEKGAFTVVATTPLDGTVSMTFECVGPGPITQFIFPEDAYPKLWEWYEEPSTTWVPIEFTFTNRESGRAFKVMQWTKFDAATKVQVRRKLKQLRE